MLVQSKQYLAPYLLYLKLVKRNQTNLVYLKQTFVISSCKPTVSHTIDRCEKRLNWCCDADGRANVEGTTNSKQLYFYVKFLVCSTLNVLFVNKLFQHTHGQDKHKENFVSQCYYSIIVSRMCISPLAAVNMYDLHYNEAHYNKA